MGTGLSMELGVVWQRGVNHILNLMYWMCRVAAVVARDEYKFLRFCDTGEDMEKAGVGGWVGG
jgi:hypothetical protein